MASFTETSSRRTSITPEKRVKVLDFGLALAMSHAGSDAGVALGDDDSSDGTRWSAARDASLHEPRAGTRTARRYPHGHLVLRLRAVRNAHRCAGVRRRQRR